jgi:hypothetical protein
MKSKLSIYLNFFLRRMNDSSTTAFVNATLTLSPAAHIILAEKFELIHVLLALLYALTLVLLWVHKLLRWSLSERPSFNVFLSVGLVLRATWLVTQNYVFDGRFGRMHGWHGFYFVLNTLPNFCFFTCYLTILFLWGRVIHRQNVAADDRHGVTRDRFSPQLFRHQRTDVHGPLLASTLPTTTSSAPSAPSPASVSSPSPSISS